MSQLSILCRMVIRYLLLAVPSYNIVISTLESVLWPYKDCPVFIWMTNLHSFCVWNIIYPCICTSLKGIDVFKPWAFSDLNIFTYYCVFKAHVGLVVADLKDRVALHRQVLAALCTFAECAMPVKMYSSLMRNNLVCVCMYVCVGGGCVCLFWMCVSERVRGWGEIICEIIVYRTIIYIDNYFLSILDYTNQQPMQSSRIGRFVLSTLC